MTNNISLEDELAALVREDEADDAAYRRDQHAAIRPELSVAWSKLKGEVSSALREWCSDLAAALARASIQERRGIAQRLAYHYVGLQLDRAWLAKGRA